MLQSMGSHMTGCLNNTAARGSLLAAADSVQP